ncbi:hypothetical protein ACOMHN_011176 [Nucella lapillus]
MSVGIFRPSSSSLFTGTRTPARAKIRGKIRESKGIDGGFGNDCVMHIFCALCALVQEAQEVEGQAPQQVAMARE